MNFISVKGANAEVIQDIEGWNDKIRNYLRDFFDGELERVRGTRFGDNIAKIAYMTERAIIEPSTWRGVRDVNSRLQAGAIVEEELDFLFLDALVTAPWNVLGNQSETISGAGTTLMEELVKESFELGNEGRIRLYPLQRSIQFYRTIGFVETDSLDWELTPFAASKFLEKQRQFWEAGRTDT
ncbi:MAG: hypothetical protein ACRC11_11415 [Xenococcaceae cyanobacterium]